MRRGERGGRARGDYPTRGSCPSLRPDLELRALEPPRVPVVTAREQLLEQAVQDDEHVARAHLADLELRDPFLAIVPAVRDDDVRVAADDRLERHLDGQVEVVREEGLDPRDDAPPIELEGVREVVVRVPEEQLDQRVAEPVQYQLVERV